jgi:hypothetical protein
MRKLRHYWKSRLAVSLALIAAPAALSAQAYTTAQRSAEVAPFVQSTIVSPDWGPQRNLGYTVGVDYTRLLSTIIEPSLEVRYMNANGQTVGEHSLTGGVKLGFAVRKVHPYATLLAGTGGIAFDKSLGYKPDNAYIYSLGGGAEFLAGQRWKVRADFLEQYWNLEPVTLSPVALSLGVAYRIPAHLGRGVH